MFSPGQRVECHHVFFEGDPELAWRRVREMGVRLPKEGARYTVCETGQELHIPVLHLWELDNAHLVPVFYSAPPGFPQVWFRPITERNADISIFTAMLNPAKDEVPE